ncbi:MAG: four helix bundle protein [Acidobacteriia bacterium]|nr:four helix bundle protein [Terriglobia bacterium]
MARIERFEDIEAWRVARELAKDTYRITSNAKFGRDFCLRDQMRRASVSILSNIAEGFERSGDKEFQQFLALAKGSCGELRSQLYIALDQQYVSEEQFAETRLKSEEVSKMLAGLIRYLRGAAMRGSKYK